ncbi:MAG: polynucleotide phosphorylase/polyadenylase [Parcubacteria group bacterium Gr01-1014_19]|nr:MAG: polynucleotide phosphorylase/polyadenylase [Parcubacteria group bacterium Gr01-1014_19]
MNLNKKLFKTEFAGQPKDSDYFPLSVDYEERFYAAGKILGSRFVRREGRPGEEAILSGRIIDRTVRPLFDHRLRREVQLVVTILEIDNESDLEFITLMTASTALAISDIPWNGPVAGVKMLFDGNKLTFNAKQTDIKAVWPAEKGFLSFVSGTAEKINMIELEGVDAEESEVAKAFDLAQKEIAKMIDWQKGIVKEIGKPKASVHLAEPDAKLVKLVHDYLDGKLEKALYTKDKGEQHRKMAEVQNGLKALLVAEGRDEKELILANQIFERVTDDLVHKKILESEIRPDGRKLDEVRDLHAEVGLLQRAHGSALFIRGETQALVVTTIAPPGAEQLMENMRGLVERRFMLHYNFPPYSTGETGRVGAPGRREIGHGALAEKAVKNLIPTEDEFPYVIRVVSEVLSSNGSSSQATTCGAVLSMMDAGIPIKKSVAGIAMGMMTGPKGEYKVLTDIQGPEDHYGDMDFKVAGSADGVRAVQMDVKIDGITNKMLVDGLAQAKQARLEILKVMNKALAAPRKEISQYAPVILRLDINPDKIGLVIGPGGKVINSIIETTGALTIDIEQTGRVLIAGPNKEKAQAALEAVQSMVKEYTIGEIVQGPIVRILEFGAIVEFGPEQDGMIHVSELKEGFVKKVEDVVKLGQVVKAKIIKSDMGKIGLSMKGVPQ